MSKLEVYQFLEELISPVGLVTNPTDNDHLYIVDQIGLIWKYNKKTKDSIKFLDIRTWMPELSPSYDERGLLSMEFHPEFGNPKSVHKETFFIFYSTRQANYKVAEVNSDDLVEKYDEKKVYYNCVSMFTRLDENGSVDTHSEQVIISIQKRLDIHNGGKIAFGPDRYLYITVGDGGPQKDPYFKAQNLKVWHGKILRIDVSNAEMQEGKRFSIPPDNPFADGKDARPEIWAFGLRNPWSIAWDRKKRLFVGDVGYDSREKVVIIEKGGNYGWPYKEGTLVSEWIKDKKDIPNDIIDPIYEYNTPDPTGAIIGGFPIPSPSNRRLTWFVFGDLSGELVIIQENSKTKEWNKISSKQLPKGLYIKSFGKDNQDMIFIMVSRKFGPTGKTGEIFYISFE